jgi:hypothetical protein
MGEKIESETPLEQIISEGNQSANECLQGLIQGTEVSGQLSRLGEIANRLQPQVGVVDLEASVHNAILKLLGVIELLQKYSGKKV